MGLHWQEYRAVPCRNSLAGSNWQCKLKPGYNRSCGWQHTCAKYFSKRTGNETEGWQLGLMRKRSNRLNYREKTHWQHVQSQASFVLATDSFLNVYHKGWRALKTLKRPAEQLALSLMPSYRVTCTSTWWKSCPLVPLRDEHSALCLEIDMYGSMQC